MSQKTSAEVLIGGRVYTLGGYESEEYLQRVAAYINNKLTEYEGMDSFRRLPADMKATLVELNIADDYFKAKAQIEKLEDTIELKDKELYGLKHNLISNQLQTESDEQTLKELEADKKQLEADKKQLEDGKKSAEKSCKSLEERVKELERENKELLLNKTKLETSLEEALLGKVNAAKK